MPEPKQGAPAPRWFAIREELSAHRRLVLTVASFAIPLLLWVVVSYVPFLWHPDVRLNISADREGVSTVYTEGDRLPRKRASEDGFDFARFVEEIRAENAQVRAARDSGQPIESSRRSNIKILRHIAPLAVANGWMPRGSESDDAAIRGVWGGLAEGTLVPGRMGMSEENLEVVRENWALLQASAPELPTTRLLKLVPEGTPSNPVYLPAPHEVIAAGWRDFTADPEPGRPSLLDRYAHSLRIILLGFFYSCLIGVPIGILCGTFDAFSRIHEPFIDFFRYMPAPTFSVILVAFLGTEDAPKIMLVFLGTFFQMVLVVGNTTRSLDRSLLEAAQTLGARSRQLIGRVIIPGILPQLYNDLRILLGWAWTWLVIAELIGEKTGLTGFIDTQGTRYNFDRVFPVIILIGLTGFFTDQILSSLRSFFFPWSGDARNTRRGPVGRFVFWLTDTSCYIPRTFPKSAFVEEKP